MAQGPQGKHRLNQRLPGRPRKKSLSSWSLTSAAKAANEKQSSYRSAEALRHPKPALSIDFFRSLLGFYAGQTRFFELVAFFPADFGGLVGGLPTQGESEAGDGGIGGPVEIGAIFVVGLVI